LKEEEPSATTTSEQILRFLKNAQIDPVIGKYLGSSIPSKLKNYLYVFVPCLIVLLNVRQ